MLGGSQGSSVDYTSVSPPESRAAVMEPAARGTSGMGVHGRGHAGRQGPSVTEVVGNEGAESRRSMSTFTARQTGWSPPELVIS